MAEITAEYNTLMSKRIHRVLFICNSYDAFALEEDGHLEAQITQEYSELNLSNPPSVTRAESTAQALDILRSGESFDLIITMYNVGAIDVFSFSKETKKLFPFTPIVLLSSYSKQIYRKIEDGDASCIDDFFCWNNSTDLIIAIIKLFEDRLNTEHDLAMGVQAILLVEDSVRYYSTYLPMLYKLVLQQNSESIREALNQQQKTLRKRARPKILMATNYEDAKRLYDRFKDNLMGVITDIGFVLHKGDHPSTEKSDAGVDLTKYIRKHTPKMPILMQSSQESMNEVAKELGVGFVIKQSKMLSAEITDYISREFGFGDFIWKSSGGEVFRIHNLLELEQMLHIIPDEDIAALAHTNLMSKWMKARGLFSLSAAFFSMSLEKDGSIEAHRQVLLSELKDYRIKQGLGVVAQFDPDNYNDAIWYARIGDGYLGGKARGMAFLNHILQKHSLYNKWDGVRVMIPKTLVVTTEYFDRFIKENGLQYVIMADLSDEELLSEFVAATLPADLTDALRAFIKTNQKPLAIRSSSLLEDSYYQPFAGVYSTYMLPHTENEDQMLRLLSKAIKSVYASVYYASSRSYITATGNVISEEKMAIILQEVCGSEQDGYYFPTFSGVARSINFYPIGHERPEDGVVKVAFGLGKAVVDGDQVLCFCPKYPRNVLQTSTEELVMTDTQKTMYALDLRPEKFKTSVDDGVNLELLPITACTQFRNLRHVASTFDMENMHIVDSAIPNGPKYITFAPILKYKTFPLASIMEELLDICAREMKCSVEIEFAANLDRGNKNPVFNVLQIRPISVDDRQCDVDWDKIDSSCPLIKSGCALGTGWINDIKDIIYIRREKWDEMHTREMAREIKVLNAKMQQEKCQYVLIGYGRWGSSIASLGVPVQWSEISETRVLVEASLDNFRVDPSQGTHFFQNLTSFNAGYINVDNFSRPGDVYDIEYLDALPAVEETEYFRHIRLEEDLKICIDGRTNQALIKF